MSYDRYKIVTDGTTVGTKVYGPDDDERFLHGVQAVHVRKAGDKLVLEIAVKSRSVEVEFLEGAPAELLAADEFWLSIGNGLIVRHDEPEAPVEAEGAPVDDA